MAALEIMHWPAWRNADQNPFNYNLSKSLTAEGAKVIEFTPMHVFTKRYAILHIHWPDALAKNVSSSRAIFRLAILTIILAWVRFFRRRPVVWTVHNIEPHGIQARVVVRILHLLLSRLVSHQVHLSSATQPVIKSHSVALSLAPSTVIFHGLYTPALQCPSSSSRRILHFGTLSSYKGTEELIRVFSGLTDSQLVLHIAGSCPDNSLKATLIRAAQDDKRIELELGWLDDRRLSTVLKEAEIVVYPYRRILNSGSVILALSHSRPVIVPSVGSMDELAELVDGNWVRTYRGELDSDRLKELVNMPTETDSPDLRHFEWSTIANKHLDLYSRLLRSGKQARTIGDSYARRT